MAQKQATLKYKNNWESDEYYVGKKRITVLKKVSIDGEEFKVTSRRVSVPYNDMGHTYTGDSNHYFIKKKVFGTKMEFDLNTIVDKVKVVALDYTVAPDIDYGD